MSIALTTVGFSTFAVLYAVQPLLPVLADEFKRSPAEASFAVSAATISLAVALLFSGLIADRLDRRKLMGAALIAAALLTLVVAFAPSWPLLLVARAATGLALGGVPAIAMTYVGEEVDADSIGLAQGLLIGGNVFGGMAGRLATGIVADHLSWRAAVAIVAVLALAGAVLMIFALPRSRRFQPRRASFTATLAGYAAPFRDRGLPWLFLQSFLCFGAFISVYNYIGFRLLQPPYDLSQTVVSLIFALYLLGVFSSAWVGDLAGRLGRRKVYWVAVAGMLVGVGLTALQPLPLVILGMGVLTFCYFGAHSVASSWVGRRAGPNRAQASGMFLFAYYLGASVLGSVGGLAWSHGGWGGLTGMLVAVLLVALAVAVGLSSLRPLPGNELQAPA
jgi:YNFM family putative membrane transporter